MRQIAVWAELRLSKAATIGAKRGGVLKFICVASSCGSTLLQFILCKCSRRSHSNKRGSSKRLAV